MKFYRGSAAAARSYVEADRSRVDDYYLAEGTGVASRYVATIESAVEGRGVRAVQGGGTLDGDAYERWVAGRDVGTGEPRGRLRTDERGLRFVEVVVNGPKTWSLAATLHPEIAAVHRFFDAAHNETAHIATTNREAGNTESAAIRPPPSVYRPEDRRPPPMGNGGSGRGIRR